MKTPPRRPWNACGGRRRVVEVGHDHETVERSRVERLRGHLSRMGPIKIAPIARPSTKTLRGGRRALEH